MKPWVKIAGTVALIVIPGSIVIGLGVIGIKKLIDKKKLKQANG